MMRVLDLFSGIGGFSLGLERTGGFETVAFCEIDPFCRRVLAKHWPGVPIYDDVTELNADTLARDGIGIDCICGGFPCQDISEAGLRTGLSGERSGLWREYARLVRELQPRYVIVENVSELRRNGLGDVLGDLAAIRYDAEWHSIPALAVGADHIRERVWIVAYPDSGAAGRSKMNEEDEIAIARKVLNALAAKCEAREKYAHEQYQQSGKNSKSWADQARHAERQAADLRDAVTVIHEITGWRP